MRRWLILVLVSAALVVGCVEPAPLPPGPLPAEPVLDCRAPAQTCQTAVQDARAQVAAGVVPIAVRVVCKPGCTILEGEADIEVRYSDGSTSTWNTGWAGAGAGAGAPPPLPVVPTCEGIAEPACSDMAQSALESAGGVGVVSIVVRCTVASCTRQAGEVSTTITYADGRTEESSVGYATSE